jgi:hypothetical protein
MTRALYRPGRDPAPDGHGLPFGDSSNRHGLKAIDERRDLVEYLGQVIPRRGRHEQPHEYARRVEDEARAMTLSDRVHLEIELTQRFRNGYSFEYDPLAY